MLFQGIQQEVLTQLKQKYGNEYNSRNVILTAIHQHSGPGGYATHALYNLTTLGFDRRNFMAISNGIVKAIERARANLQPGQTVVVKFYGGNPKKKFRTMGTFLKVQKKTAHGWATIANDNNWDTTYHWQRDGIAASIITIDWRIPKQQAAGTYRIIHYGDVKNGLSGKISSYRGVSNSFMLR